jgi:hypothetical protein
MPLLLVNGEFFDEFLLTVVQSLGYLDVEDHVVVAHRRRVLPRGHALAAQAKALCRLCARAHLDSKVTPG